MFKPFPKPPFVPGCFAKPARLPNRKAMTIIAGFQCLDGIVLCADTQESLGEYLKRDQPKIVTREPLSGERGNRAVFAGAGSGDFIDYLVDKLWAVMEGGESTDAMVQAAEKELVAQYEKLVPIYPSGMSDASFLVGIWARPPEDAKPPEGMGDIPVPWADNIELLRITGPLIKRKVHLDAIGAGWVIATYIANRLIWPKQLLSKAIPIAIYMIDEAKQHVKDCGGDTQVVTLDGEGKIEHYSQEEIKERTKHFRAMDSVARQIVGLAMDDDLTEKQYKALLDDTIKRMDWARKAKP